MQEPTVKCICILYIKQYTSLYLLTFSKLCLMPNNHCISTAVQLLPSIKRCGNRPGYLSSLLIAPPTFGLSQSPSRSGIYRFFTLSRLAVRRLRRSRAAFVDQNRLEALTHVGIGRELCHRGVRSMHNHREKFKKMSPSSVLNAYTKLYATFRTEALS